MYHIPSDIRAHKSAMHICDAILKCSKHKPFSEITVSELSKNYGISRTTFYRLFDNIVDVLEYACDYMGQSILLHIEGNSPKEMTINTISALKNRKDFINLLFRSGHSDIFQKVHEKYFPLSRLSNGIDFKGDTAYFHTLLAHMIPIAINIWTIEGEKDSPDELYEKLSQSIKMLEIWFSE